MRTSVRILAVALCTIGFEARSATATVETPDRNYYVRAVDWIADGPGTRVLVLSYAAPSQPHVREGCTANFYVLHVRPGLDNPELVSVADGYCGHRLHRSGHLLANGEVALLIDGQVDIRRPQTGQFEKWSLSDVESLRRYHPTVTKDVRITDAYPDGTVAFAGGLPRARGDATSPSAVVVSFYRDGTVRWQHELAQRGVDLSPMDIWATADGGALLHVNATPMDGPGMPPDIAPPDMSGSENRLYRFSPNGKPGAPVVIASFGIPAPPSDMPDPTTDPEGYREAFQRYTASMSMDTYGSDELVGEARVDGSVDLLAQRRHLDEDGHPGGVHAFHHPGHDVRAR